MPQVQAFLSDLARKSFSLAPLTVFANRSKGLECDKINAAAGLDDPVMLDFHRRSTPSSPRPPIADCLRYHPPSEEL